MQQPDLALEHPWVGRLLGARANGRALASSFPPPGAPRGAAGSWGRAEASQLGAAVVCHTPPALTSPPPSRKQGSSCRLRRARGANPRRRKAASVRRLASVGGEHWDRWPCSSPPPPPPCKPWEGKPCRKPRRQPGWGAVLSPPSQRCEKDGSREIRCRASAMLPWLGVGGSERACSLLHVEIPYVRHKYSIAGGSGYFFCNLATEVLSHSSQ